MKRNTSILIVDDEKTILYSLQKMISAEFSDIDVILASDGEEAWNKIQNHHPAILISDINMPGMDGKQLLNKVRQNSEFDSVYIVILTAYNEKGTRNELLEIGADDFILKSSEPDDIKYRIRSALRIVKLQEKVIEENEVLQTLAQELESDIEDITMLAVKFMEARIPASLDTLKKIAETSVWIAKAYENYDAETIRNIEIASYLSMAGRILLPDSLLHEPVMIDGKTTNPLMHQVPVSGKEIVSSISRFKTVGKYIYHIYENFDGTGIPGKLQSWQIPFPSRIIRVVTDYYEKRKRSTKSAETIIAEMLNQSKRLYDHRTVVLLDHYIRSVSKEIFDPDERAVKLSDLTAGMQLTRDVITDSGLKLIPVGGKLTERSIEMIINHNSNDTILGGLYVKKS